MTFLNQTVRYGCIMMLMSLGSFHAQAIVRTWTGDGPNALASTPTNWSDDTAPENGDSVMFDATSSTDCDWDLDIAVANWTQTADYAGTVTIRTVYPTAPLTPGAFTNLVITGDVTLSGGTWTHIANSGDHDAVDRLAVSVGGNFTLTAPAGINLTGRGFAMARGLGAGSDDGQGSRRSMFGRGASHGGQGGWGSNVAEPAPTYGSIAKPETLGSGASRRGGGALRLVVDGTATIDGLIQANGVPRADDSSPGAAGGSIFLMASKLGGSGVNGVLSARGASGYQAGGGGRIAVHLDACDDFSAVQFQAAGNTGPTTASGWIPQGISGSGTIYLEGDNNGERIAWLLIDNADVDDWGEGGMTPLPSELSVGDIEPYPATGNGKLAAATLDINAAARVWMLEHFRMRDLERISDDSTLYLNNFTLYFKDEEPPDFPDLSEPSDDPVSIPVALGGGTIDPDGGRVLWDDLPFQIVLPIWSGPNGTIDNYDPETFYDYDSLLTFTAVPNAGYTFVRWLGAIPETENPFTQELTVPVLPETHLRAVFASTAADTFTWLGGDGSDGLAGTDANWYPEGVPGNGDHIVLDGASFENLEWDMDISEFSERWADWSLHSMDIDWGLDIEAASWTQSEDYTGNVLIRTRFPGHGAFSNLVVHGDCLIDGGTWTHPENDGNETETDRLSFKVGGDFRLGPDATIDVSGRGFADFRGPGKGYNANRAGGMAASHGGQGAYDSRDHDAAAATYGSVTRPANLGSGGDGRGGGLVNIIASGTATIDGIIRAHGQDGQRFDPPRYSASAGGSVYVQAAAIAGTGSVSAAGGSGYYSAGGGRVALVAANSPTLSQIDASALPGPQDLIKQDVDDTQRRGTPGTVYVETTEAAYVIVDARGLAPQSANPDDPPPILFTPLMPDIRPALPQPWWKSGELADATLVIRDEGVVGLTSDLRMRDLAMADETSRLRLQGYDLFLGVILHSNWGEKDWVVYDGGRIRWLSGTLILVR